MAVSIKSLSFAGPGIPVNVSIILPLCTKNTVGTDLILRAVANYGRLSMFNLISLNLPSFSTAAFSSIGISLRHGEHHSAKQSKTTGLSLYITLELNSLRFYNSYTNSLL